MNVWFILLEVAKTAFMVILGFMALFGVSNNLTMVLNAFIEKKKVNDTYVFNMLMWFVVCIFTIIFLINAWF